MKSYFQGMITGFVLGFSIFLFMGQYTVPENQKIDADKLIESFNKSYEEKHKRMKNNVNVNADIGTYQLFVKDDMWLIDTRNGYLFNLDTDTREWKPFK